MFILSPIFFSSKLCSLLISSPVDSLRNGDSGVQALLVAMVGVTLEINLSFGLCYLFSFASSWHGHWSWSFLNSLSYSQRAPVAYFFSPHPLPG